MFLYLTGFFFFPFALPLALNKQSSNKTTTGRAGGWEERGETADRAYVTANGQRMRGSGADAILVRAGITGPDRETGREEQ